MFLPALSRLRQTVAFRLAAWHAAIFVISLVVLFLIVDFTLSRSLRKNDHVLLRAELKSVLEEYGEGGVPAVAKLVSEESPTFIVRVADSHNKTRFITSSVPANVVAQLEKGSTSFSEKWKALKIGSGDEYEIQSAALPQGMLIQVARSSHQRQLFLTHFRRVCAAIIGPMIILGICGGILFARRTLRPLHDLSGTVHRIVQTGELTERIPEQRAPGELMELVHSFNQMLQRIETLIRSMRESLDNVAHELRTPMTRLHATAETALRDPSNAAVAQSALAECVEECEQAMILLRTLTDIAEAQAGALKLNLQSVDLADLARRIADLYQQVAEDKGIEIVVDMPDAITLRADNSRLPQVVANLVDNAVKYTYSGGRITLSAHANNGEVAFSVKDTGIGIAAEELDRIWERLYRADKSRSVRGLGLGLAVVKAIVESHRGRVTLQSTPNRGSTFTIFLPTEA